MTAAASAAWSTNDAAVAVAAASESPVAKLASHESAASCALLTTSPGLGNGPLLDFRLQKESVQELWSECNSENVKDGENKLPALVSFLRSQNCSFGDPARRNVAAAAVQLHTDGGDKLTECWDDEAYNHNVEASGGAASTSTKTAAQKQKSKKKPKKAKGRGRK